MIVKKIIDKKFPKILIENINGEKGTVDMSEVDNIKTDFPFIEEEDGFIVFKNKYNRAEIEGEVFEGYEDLAPEYLDAHFEKGGVL